MTDREILVNLIAGLSLADHLGDVYADCERAVVSQFELGSLVVRLKPVESDGLNDRACAPLYGANGKRGKAIGEDEGEPAGLAHPRRSSALPKL